MPFWIHASELPPGVVEFFYIVAIVGEVGPAQIRQRAGGDQSVEIAGALEPRRSQAGAALVVGLAAGELAAMVEPVAAPQQSVTINAASADL